MHAYITVSLTAGLRTEEVRALRWDHVVARVNDQWLPVTVAGFDHEQLAVFVWRSVRVHGETKTERSRRCLELPRSGVGEDWTPRELRHSFVSLMSERGITTEEISRLVGHSSTRVTEVVYRHELRPVLRAGAEVMDTIFNRGTA